MKELRIRMWESHTMEGKENGYTLALVKDRPEGGEEAIVEQWCSDRADLYNSLKEFTLGLPREVEDYFSKEM